MHIPGFIDRRTMLRGRRLWLHYGVFWLGAVATGLIAVMYARLIDFGYEVFLRITAFHWWLPLLLTPAVGAFGVWVTRRFFPGAEGSGIPQVIAVLHDGQPLGPKLLTIRILVGKIAISFLSILGGETISSLAGLGHRIVSLAENMETSRMFSNILFAVLIAIVINVIVTFAEARGRRGMQ